MIEAIEKAARKPLSVVMSVLLAALLVPTVPASNASAYADDEPTQGQETEDAQTAGWSPIQSTDSDTHLPNRMVYKNYGFENVSTVVDGFDGTLSSDLGVVKDKLVDPTDETAKDNKDYEAAKKAARVSAEDAAKTAIAAQASVGAADEAKATLNSSMSKDDMVKLLAEQYANWYNGELAKENYGAVGESLKAKIASDNGCEPTDVELDKPEKLNAEDLAKEGSWFYNAVVQKIVASAVKSGDVDVALSENPNDLSVSGYAWGTADNVTVTSVSGDDNIDASFKDGTLEVKAKGAGEGTLTVGFSYGKTLTGYTYSASNASYKYSYTGTLKVQEVFSQTVNVGWHRTGATADVNVAWGSSKGSSGESSSSDAASDEPKSESGDSQGSTEGTTTGGKSVEISVDPANFVVTGDSVNGEVTTDGVEIGETTYEGSVDNAPMVTLSNNSFTHEVKIVNLFPEELTAAQNNQHDEYNGDSDSLTYFTDRNGKTIDGIFSGLTFAEDEDNKYGNKEEALKLLGDSKLFSASTPEGELPCIDVSYSSENATDSLTVKALNATYYAGEDAATQTATLTWTLPDNTVVKHTVDAMVNPLKIVYGGGSEASKLSDQPFRLQDTQQKKVCADANAKVKAAIADQAKEGVQPATDLYSKVEFGNYDSTSENAQTLYLEPKNELLGKMTFERCSDSLLKDRQNGYGNYEIDDAASVTIAQMESVAWGQKIECDQSETSALILEAKQGQGNDEKYPEKGVTLTKDNCKSTWVNTVPEAVWAYHGLVYASKGIPQSEDAFSESGAKISLNGGQGVHTSSIYAISEDGVICQVTGIVYQFDNIAPRLNSWTVSDPYTVADNIFFKKDLIKVEFAITDAVPTGSNKNAANSNADGSTVVDAKTNTETINGNINSRVGETKASYHDSESGKSTEVWVGNGLTQEKAESEQTLPVYSFNIEGNKDVAAESIRVVSWDNAGNKLDTTAADSAEEVPMQYVRLVSDADAPRISVAWDTNDARHGSYYQTNRTMTLTINEEFFEYVQQYANDQVITTVYRDGEAAIAVYPSDFSKVGDNTWEYELSFTDDADYVVTDPTVRDIVDRYDSCNGDSFTVDKTSPTMEVSFDNNNVVNGKYYQQARTATITVNEHNFSGDLVNVQPTVSAGNGSTTGAPSVSGWSDNGDVHTATVTFPGEGVYAMTIDGVDLADNSMSSYTCEEFVVDTIDPQVDITLNGAAAPELSALSGEATPAVSVHDTNISPDASATGTTIEAIGLSGSGTSANPYEPTKSVTSTATDTNISWANPDSSKTENDGVYQMIVTATDLSGRTTTKAVIWSVNRYGSTYRLLDNATAMSGQYMKYSAGNTTSKVKDVQVEEINPSGIDVTKTAVELTKGSNNTTLKNGSQYNVEPGTANDNTTGWHTYVYTVNRDNFKDSGRYQVTMHSVDNASNVSENTMSGKGTDRKSSAEVSFWVDDVKPVCNIVGVENDKTYEGDSQNMTLTFEDNLKLAGATVEIQDGSNSTRKEFTADDLKASTTQTIKLDASGSNQSVRVVATDAAGNISDEVSVSGIYVNSDKFALWMHNTPLFVASIVGGIVVIGLIVLGILALLRRRKDEDKQEA